VRNLFTSRSLFVQLILLGVTGLALGVLTAIVILACYPHPEGHLMMPQVLTAMLVGGVVGIEFWAITARQALRPLCQLQEDFENSRQALAARTQTVDRLLEFSQTIQGAGHPEQIFQCLSFFLRTELGLAGLAIVAYAPESAAPLQVKASWPDDLVANEINLSEMDTALCPCLRQNLPREFAPACSPVRCAIDRAIRLPETHPAYCVPFTLGRRSQCVVHMLLPEEHAWTEQLKQLAATYINTAYSSLMSLNLLAEAEQRSLTDPLTQLYNRRSMEQLLQREVALSERHSQPLSLVMIDMDNFKQINDAHGHAAGDHMLKTFADCVRMTLRRTDLAFRVGGDEFVIVLPQTTLAQAQQVVQKLRQAFAAVDFSSAITKLENHPTLSIGVAERSRIGNVLTLTNLLSAADEALYEAKNSARNCVRVYQPQRAA
jgi:diguanylate cyclase (GGDEF)-like protein